jgi:hypothetical protein
MFYRATNGCGDIEPGILDSATFSKLQKRLCQSPFEECPMEMLLGPTFLSFQHLIPIIILIRMWRLNNATYFGFWDVMLESFNMVANNVLNWSLYFQLHKLFCPSKNTSTKIAFTMKFWIKSENVTWSAVACDEFTFQKLFINIYQSSNFHEPVGSYILTFVSPLPNRAICVRHGTIGLC